MTKRSHHTDSGAVQTLVRVSVAVTGNTLPQEQTDSVSVVTRGTFLQGGITHLFNDVITNKSADLN